MATVLPPNRIFSRVPQQLEDYVGGMFNDSVVAVKAGKDGGIFTYYGNQVFPRKGLVYPAAARHNNIMKGVFMASLFSLATFRPTVKWLENTLDKVNRLAERVYLSSVPNDIKDTADTKYNCEQCGQSLAPKLVRPDFMKYQYYNPFSQEIWQVTFLFLRYLGISSLVSFQFGRLLGTLFEYEEPYRLRGEDVCSIIDPQELLDHPGLEVRRVMAEYTKREKNFADNGYGVGNKFKYLGIGLSWLLWVPKFRRAFRFAVRNTNFDKLRMDIADMYYALLNPSYNFFGEGDESREQKLIELCASMGIAIEIKK